MYRNQVTYHPTKVASPPGALQASYILESGFGKIFPEKQSLWPAETSCVTAEIHLGLSFPKTQMDGKAVAAFRALVNRCDALNHKALTEPTWNLSLHGDSSPGMKLKTSYKC